jgi:hypothetical protein
VRAKINAQTINNILYFIGFAFFFHTKNNIPNPIIKTQDAKKIFSKTVSISVNIASEIRNMES